MFSRPMKRSPKIHAAGSTDKGRVRFHNEDAFLILDDYHVYVVADGVGGLEGGEVASSKVIEMIAEEVETLETGNAELTHAVLNQMVTYAVRRANSWIREEARERQIRAMGTTIVLFMIDPQDHSKAECLHAGDSRVYRLRNKQIELITADHSLATQMNVEEHSLPAQMQGVITRAIGIKTDVELESTPMDLKKGDRILVCSDGLNRMLTDGEIESLLAKGPLKDRPNHMVRSANLAGGYDNITCVVVDIG